MKCQKEKSLTNGGSKTKLNGLKMKKDTHIWNQVKHRRLRSHRKTNKEMEDKRIRRWKNNVEQWKESQQQKVDVIKIKTIQAKKKEKKKKQSTKVQ